MNLMNLSQVLTELKKKGKEQTRKTYARHGIDIPMFGVSVADLKTIAKKIKGDQALASSCTTRATTTPCTSPAWSPTARR